MHYFALVRQAQNIRDELCCEYHRLLGDGPTGPSGDLFIADEAGALLAMRDLQKQIKSYQEKIAMLGVDPEIKRICADLGISTNPETYGQRIK